VRCVSQFDLLNALDAAAPRDAACQHDGIGQADLEMPLTSTVGRSSTPIKVSG